MLDIQYRCMPILETCLTTWWRAHYIIWISNQDYQYSKHAILSWMKSAMHMPMISSQVLTMETTSNSTWSRSWHNQAYSDWDPQWMQMIFLTFLERCQMQVVPRQLWRNAAELILRCDSRHIPSTINLEHLYMCHWSIFGTFFSNGTNANMTKCQVPWKDRISVCPFVNGDAHSSPKAIDHNIPLVNKRSHHRHCQRKWKEGQNVSHKKEFIICYSWSCSLSSWHDQKPQLESFDSFHPIQTPCKLLTRYKKIKSSFLFNQYLYPHPRPYEYSIPIPSISVSVSSCLWIESIMTMITLHNTRLD
jgi:hypothetical protein